MKFTHLHTHSQFSLLDGVSSIPALVEAAKERGMDSLSLTDHGNMHGSLQLYRECRKRDMNPVAGIEAYISIGDHRHKKGARSSKQGCTHLTLLSQNEIGFRNLLKLSSLSYTEGFYYKPRISKELLRDHSEGIVCLSGCVSSEFSRALLDDKEDEAIEIAQFFSDAFKDRFYIEIMNGGFEIQSNHLERAVPLANKLGIPLVATSDVHYRDKEDHKIQEIGLCISTKKKMSDPNRMKIDHDSLYLKSPEEMYSDFQGLEHAVARSQDIADSCDLQLDLNQRFFPKYQLPEQVPADKYLKELCLKGIEERYDTVTSEVRDRLLRELQVIAKLGFSQYFLVTWDMVKFANDKGIPTNARGSGVGSIVCYALRISHICPLEHGLLFERFLDENRKEPPDVDLDICKSRRWELIEYVKEKYGEECVAQIGTFGTLACRNAIKDVCRVLGVTLDRVSEILDTIPDTLGVTIDQALEESEEFAGMYRDDPQVKEVVDYAKKLENRVRNIGTHAAAVVVADKPLHNFVPLMKTKDGSIITQWSMNDVEAAGLLKIDFLGLRNLTMISDCINMVRENHGVEIDVDKLPMDDKETYELLQRGETKGVFQLESSGIREMLIKMKPTCFSDIIAASALYRPGPLNSGMVDEYIDVKNGKKRASYVHPIMEEVLSETHGVIVYQEQVMQVLHRLGGIELSKAYTVIKAISKKKEEVISSNEATFMEGATSKGVPLQQAAEIWNMILQFAAYGFNKSHSASYGKVTYITAYLKSHFPTEFMAALLTADIPGRNFKKKDRLTEHLDDCRRMDIEIVPPDVNLSQHGFTATKDGKIIFGLGAIKSVGDATHKIESADRPFKDLYDFSRKTGCHKSIIETLAQAGAFDSLHPCRASVASAAILSVKGGKSSADAAARGMSSLFGDEPEEKQELPKVPSWDDTEALGKEKEVLGVYLSDHPLKPYRDDIETFSSCSTVEFSELRDRDEVVMAGMIGGVELSHVKNKQPGSPSQYARFQLEDLYGSIDCTVWPDAYRNLGYKIDTGRIVVTKGYVDKRGAFTNLIVSEIFTIQEFSCCHTTLKGAIVYIETNCFDTVLSFNDLLLKHPGSHSCYIHSGGKTMLSRKHKVAASTELKQEIENLGLKCQLIINNNVSKVKRAWRD